METSKYDFNCEPYRRVPMNSATTQREWAEYNSIGTYSANSNWSKSRSQVIATTYIDGMSLFGRSDRSHSIRDSFPKGKARQKPSPSKEKKNVGHESMVLESTDQLSPRSDKSVLSSSIVSISNLPKVSHKSVNHFGSNKIIFDNQNQSKFYARDATASNNDGWIRRYKSINRSQILNDILREESYGMKNHLKKRLYQQLLLSPSSSFKSLNKRRREKT